MPSDQPPAVSHHRAHVAASAARESRPADRRPGRPARWTRLLDEARANGALDSEDFVRALQAALDEQADRYDRTMRESNARLIALVRTAYATTGRRVTRIAHANLTAWMLAAVAVVFGVWSSDQQRPGTAPAASPRPTYFMDPAFAGTTRTWNAGDTVTISYFDPERAGMTVVIEVTGGDPATVFSLPLTLDNVGRASTAFTVPAAWTGATLRCGQHRHVVVI